MNDVVYEAVSLGHLCQTKFQIARRLNDLGHPGLSEMALRLELAPFARGERYFGWGVFDWVGGPIDTVSECIERDFVGTFEREDMILKNGEIHHRVLKINHVHAFEEFGHEFIDEAQLERRYPYERASYERRAQAFLERLHKPGPILYIHQSWEFPTADQTARLLAALGSKSADHKFHLLLVAPADTDQDLSAFQGQVTKSFLAKEIDKPKGRDWEGPDASWDVALGSFLLKPPEGAKTLPPKAPKPAPEPEPELQPRKSLFARLLGR